MDITMQCHIRNQIITIGVAVMFSLDRYEVAVLLAHGRHLGVGREPGEGEAPEHRLHRLPAGLLHPPRLLLLQRLYARLVVPDGGHLGPEHDRGEQTEEQTLKQQEENEDHGGGGRVGRACSPVPVDAADEVIDAQKKTVV